MKAKITHIPVEKRIVYKQSKEHHIRAFDEDNRYPQRVEAIVHDSKTSIGCLRIRQKFLIGGGFTDKKFYNYKVNEKETADQLLRKITRDFAFFQSIAIHVNYNSFGEIVELNYVPFSNVRISESQDVNYADKYVIYSDWGMVRKQKVYFKDLQFIDKFNPDLEVILEQVEHSGGWDNYKGQLYVYTPEAGEYPLYFADVTLEYAMAEGELKKFVFKSIKNNFLASTFVITGKKESEAESAEFLNNLANFQGGDGTGRLMWIEKEMETDLFELKQVDIQNYDKLYEWTAQHIKDSVREVFNIPETLFIAIQNKLGSSNEIDEAVSLYNGNTADERMIIEEVFRELFDKWHEVANESNDYSVLPYKYPKSTTQIKPEYFPYYTTNEIREANGDAPIVEQGALKIKL